jgi:hypothetical protein
MLKINISTIDINSISNIGSLNIGKTILCNNHASIIDYPTPEDSEENGEEVALGGDQTPTPGVAPIPDNVPVPETVPAPSSGSNVPAPSTGPNVPGPII